MKEDQRRRESDLWYIWDNHIKDVAMFVFGAIGFFHELLIRDEPDLIIIAASGALLGLPLVMTGDAIRRKTNGNGKRNE